MRHKLTDQRAFTILELMIASMVFSVILLLVTTGVVQIGRTYYRGVLQSQTQETARNIIDEISRGIQFSGEDVIGTTLYRAAEPYPSVGNGTVGGRYGMCIGGVVYSFILDKQLRRPGDTNNADNRGWVFASYRPTNGCGVGFVPDGEFVPPFTAWNNYRGDPTRAYRELLGPGMRILDLRVDPVAGLEETYTITVAIGAGERDLYAPFEPTPLVDPNTLSTNCAGGGSANNQFCAVSRLTTTVQKRVR